MLGPYALLFLFFIAAPIIVAVVLSFTYFNMVSTPEWNGLANYIKAFTQDDVLMRNVLPNMIVFSVVVGAVGFILQFLLAWSLAQISRWPRTILALIFYSPSMTAGVTLSVVWKVLFAGDEFGYLNNFLLTIGAIDAPIQWLQSPQYILPIMIIASLWSSMGVGFLSMMAGVLNIDAEIYEAGYIDGVRNRFQEILYITVPSMKPQMLFGAVMAIVNSFSGRPDRHRPDRGQPHAAVRGPDHGQPHHGPGIPAVQHGIRHRVVGAAPAADPPRIPARQ